jgi:hypothetical protein
MDKGNFTSSIDNLILSKQQSLSNRNIKIGGVICVCLIVVFSIYLSFQYFVGVEESTSKDLNEAAEIVNTDEMRQHFKGMLSDFEIKVQPLLDDSELANWSIEKVESSIGLKNKSISHFSKGKYAEALVLLEKSQEDVLTLNQDWNAALSQKVALSQTAFDLKEINKALLFITQALNIKSTDPDALQLKQRISVNPEVQKLYNLVNVAKVENKPVKQVDLLERILFLDDKQTEAAAELEKVKAQVLDERFQGYINSGLLLASQNKLSRARGAYSNAKSIYSQRPELGVLADKIAQLQENYSISQIHKNIKTLKYNDDWIGVLELVNDALKTYPNDEVVLENRKLAGIILVLRNEAATYLNKPERLSDLNVQNHALDFIKQAVSHIRFSAGLASDVKAIAEHIDSRSAKHSVIIVSDGYTHITILKTGIVGETMSKTINLPAGVYEVVGSRKGYKTKQLTLNVGSGYSNQLTMVCDERIR